MDYASNSHKDKDPKKPEPPEKKLEKVVTGEVVQKPKSLGKKIKSIFFGGEFKSASRYILGDVLLPAARNAVVDATTKGIERMVYGESPRRPTTPGYRTQYQYNSPVRRQTPSPSVMIPGQPPYRGPGSRINRREANDIILATREEAELVLERLTDVVDQYGVASLADLYELLGLPSAHVDHKWGWTYLTNATVRQLREGYMLELPTLEEI